jgi:hypothetical protein
VSQQGENLRLVFLETSLEIGYQDALLRYGHRNPSLFWNEKRQRSEQAPLDQSPTEKSVAKIM